MTGCATTVRTVTVEKTVNIFIKPPDSLLEKCNIDSPPSRQDYKAADWPGKEALLTVHARSQITNLNACNKRIDSLKSWINDQVKIYNPAPKE